jgi:hypothetical protein
MEVRGSWNNSVGAAAFTSPVGKVIFSGSTTPASITTTGGLKHSTIFSEEDKQD